MITKMLGFPVRSLFLLFLLLSCSSTPRHHWAANADQVFSDDVIVTSSMCVGQDCVNGESFGFDTLRIKENNVRIKFQDTSSSGSFPSNDWQITINDSANGGANFFGIDDINSGKRPFTVAAGAPEDSLYVASNGNVGLGTSEPVNKAHLKSSDSPGVRLEQDGTGGFTAQTWDVIGDEEKLYVRDVTNSNAIPLQIEAGTGDITLTGTLAGSHKHGILAKISLDGAGVGSVAFGSAYASTNYNVQLTAQVNTGSTPFSPMILNKSVSGFDIKVAGDLTDLIAVNWMAFPTAPPP